MQYNLAQVVINGFNHILIDFIYSFPYRKVCNYFQIAHFLGQ